MSEIRDFILAIVNYNSIGKIVIVFAVTLLIYGIEILFYRTLRRRLGQFKLSWGETILDAIHPPLGAFIWLMGASYAADTLHAAYPKIIVLNAFPTLREIAIIIIIAWFMLRLIVLAEDFLGKTNMRIKTMDKTTVNLVSQILRAIVVISAVLACMQALEYKITGLLALGSVGGIVLGLAAKDMLANFFGGMMIYFDKPFKVGDWIRSPDRDIEGTVEYIGWRLCRIRTLDKRPLYVPNSIFSGIVVENASRMSNRRIKAQIGIRYDDSHKIEVMLGDIRDMVKTHPAIDPQQIILVNLVEFGASALNFMVYAFTKTIDWAEFQMVQQDVFLKILDIINRHDAQCAFPTTTLHLPTGMNINKEK